MVQNKRKKAIRKQTVDGDRPLISVIMPAYNAERTIAGAINSILAQTYENWELIIINDGSDDRTQEIIEKFYDKRIQIQVSRISYPKKLHSQTGWNVSGSKLG